MLVCAKFQWGIFYCLTINSHYMLYNNSYYNQEQFIYLFFSIVSAPIRLLSVAPMAYYELHDPDVKYYNVTGACRYRFGILVDDPIIKKANVIYNTHFIRHRKSKHRSATDWIQNFPRERKLVSFEIID